MRIMFREIARYLGQGVNAAAPTGKQLDEL